MVVFNDLIERLKKIGIPIAENLFYNLKKKPAPQPPYLLYTATEKNYGHDFGNGIREIEGTFLLFTSRNPDKEIERQIEETVFFDTKYEKDRVFIDEENLFQTAYYINLFEKIRKEN